MNKKLLFITALLVCIALLRTTDFAIENYNITVNDIQVSDQNASDVLGDGTVSYDKEHNQLVLCNANLSKIESNINSTLSIAIIGKNTVKLDSGDAAIKTSSGLTLIGSGALEISGKDSNHYMRCIDSKGEVVVNGPRLKMINSNNAGIYVSSGENITLSHAYVTGNAGCLLSTNNGSGGGKLTIEDSTVKAPDGNGEVTGFCCLWAGDLKIIRSQIEIEAPCAICAYGNAEINSSNVYVKSTSAPASGAAGQPGIMVHGNLSLTGNDIKSESVRHNAIYAGGVLTVSGGNILANTGHTSAAAINSAGKIDVTGPVTIKTLSISGKAFSPDNVVIKTSAKATDMYYEVFAGDDEYATQLSDSPFKADTDITEKIGTSKYLKIQEHTRHIYNKSIIKEEAIKIPPTCIQPGVYYNSCVCGKISPNETEIFYSAYGTHDMEEISSKAATCTIAGNNKYYHCTECDKYFKDASGQEETSIEEETIVALGHDLKKTDRVEATCTEAGKEEYYTCQRADCGKYYADENAGTEIADINTYGIIEAKGHNMEEISSKAATCTIAGNNKYYHCTECDKYFKDELGQEETSIEEENIPALGHDLIKTDKVEATCTETGKEEYYTCQRSDCGKYYADENAETEIADINTYGIIEAKGHNMEEISSKAATCTISGNNKYYHCTECDKYFKDASGQEETSIEEETIVALGHDLKKTDRVEATCTEAGKEEYYTCQRADCGKYYADENTETEIADINTYGIIEAKGHNMEEISSKAATCTTAGNNKYYHCTECDKYFKDASGQEETSIEEETIAALGHDLKKTDRVEATCTEAGKEEYYTCQRGCGKYYADENAETEITDINSYGIIEAKGHSHMEEIPSKAATCTTAGNNKYYHCTECDKYFKDESGQEETSIEEEIIAALGHDLKKTDRVEATCTEAGKEEYYTCQRADCGKYYADENAETEITDINSYGIIEAKGHSHMEEIPSKAATCTTAGNNKYYHCTECDKYFKDESGQEETSIEEETIAALGHDLIKMDRVEATCTEAGKEEYYTCKRGCGKYFADKNAETEIKDIKMYGIIRRTDHIYKDGKCTICDAIDPDIKSDSTTNNTQNTGGKNPQTGDTTERTFWIMLLIMSTAGMSIVNWRKRKSKTVR